MVPAEGVGSTCEIETVSNLNKTHNYRKNELNVTLNCALIVNSLKRRIPNDPPL